MSIVQSAAGRRVEILGLMGMAAAGAAVAATSGARLGLMAAGAVAAVYLLANFEVAILLLTVSGYFGAAAADSGGPLGFVKLLGALALGAWLIDWAVRRRRVTMTSDYAVLGLLLVWLVPTTLLAEYRSDAVHTALRFVMFAALFFLVVQYTADRRSLGRFIDVSIAAATLASAVGLGLFLLGRTGQASGPLAHNDFAFMLSSVLPLAIWRARHSSRRWTTALAAGASAVIALAIAGTLSRGAMTGFAVGIAWLVWARRTRLRPAREPDGATPARARRSRRFYTGVAAATTIVTLALAVALVKTGVVDRAVSRKSSIAAQNVDSRLYYWQIAVREFDAYPFTGVGPGNYTDRFTEYGPVYDWTKGVQTTHNTYLNILAELGPIGLALFLAFLYTAWGRMRVRGTTGTAEDEFQSALAVAFLVTLVAAMFLTEQFQPPLWTLPALAAMGPVSRARTRRSPQ